MKTKKLLSPTQAVGRYPELGSVGTLANLRSQKRGIPFYRIGNRVFYSEDDIEAFRFKRPVLTIDAIEAA